MPIPPTIIEFTIFTRMWKAMRLTDDDFLALEDEMLAVLETAPRLSGCCGARKMRFAPPSGNVGKSGSTRVVFKFFPILHTVVLVVVYPKNVQENISAKDKKTFCDALNAIEKELTQHLG